MVADFHRDGYAILSSRLAPSETAALSASIQAIDPGDGVRSRGGVYAIRNLLQLSPAIAELAQSARLRSLAEGLLGAAAFPVRGTLFDKTPGANWIVPWHQDLTICVAARRDVPGYGPWTLKAGVCHVQPPAAILEGMVSLRIHLDRCDASNGALRVLPGTHRLGRLSKEAIAEQAATLVAECCAAEEGEVLAMRPLLVHASSAASAAAHRRVIHLDYASCALDGGLERSAAFR